MNKVLCIVQARLSSVRLPGKVLLQIPPESGVSILEMVIRKTLLATKLDEIVVVTPDTELVKICRMCGVDWFVKGWPERDVLKEYYEAAKSWKADVVVRVTGDCPCLRPEEIDRCVKAFQEGGYDLIFNTDESTGQLNGEGSDVEVMSFEALSKAYREAPVNEREHVTTFIRRSMKTRFLEGAPLGIRSVNTYDDYLYVLSYINGNRCLDSSYV